MIRKGLLLLIIVAICSCRTSRTLFKQRNNYEIQMDCILTFVSKYVSREHFSSDTILVCNKIFEFEEILKYEDVLLDMDEVKFDSFVLGKERQFYLTNGKKLMFTSDDNFDFVFSPLTISSSNREYCFFVRTPSSNLMFVVLEDIRSKLYVSTISNVEYLIDE